jgi:hypothetical protein
VGAYRAHALGPLPRGAGLLAPYRGDTRAGLGGAAGQILGPVLFPNPRSHSVA